MLQSVLTVTLTGKAAVLLPARAAAVVNCSEARVATSANPRRAIWPSFEPKRIVVFPGQGPMRMSESSERGRATGRRRAFKRAPRACGPWAPTVAHTGVSAPGCGDLRRDKAWSYFLHFLR